MLDSTTLLQLWGKTDRETQNPDVFHPAIYHMLDVAHVAKVILIDPGVSPRWKNALAHAFNANAEQLASWLPYLLALHDIGKISAAFQGKETNQKARIIQLGFSFGNWSFEKDVTHSVISQMFVADAYDGVEMPDFLRQACCEMLGGHHGRFNGSQVVNDARTRLQAYEPADWHEYRVETAQMLAKCLLDTDFPLPQPANLSAAIMTLTGFSILCDWLGSNSDFFRLSNHVSLDEYLLLSQKRACDVVVWAGLCQPAFSQQATEFACLFPDIASPRPLQQAIDEIPSEMLQGPCLAIIEAPTGEGKTEAALALAHRLAHGSSSDEFYYALPTTATSNQMFGRIQKHLIHRLKIPTLTKLVHGQAFLVEDDLRITPLSNGNEHGYADSLEWFAPRKRSLLAPFGVGTVDQAELAALNVKHVPLRLMGLAGKVLILDEIHAYDTYMTTIIERLLEWLFALGSSVILLSATLPLSRRKQLAQTYSLKDDMESSQGYPSLMVVSEKGLYQAAPAASQPDRSLFINTGLHLGDDDALEKACWLLDQVQAGGCACWITNSVDRAQQIFQALEQLSPVGVDRALLHARFPLEQRQGLEKALIAKYGPDGKRPARGIVIGTQVLEQSLDIDFDIMVSDLAPVDLLLQRAGRLHRHTRSRQASHSQPCLWINTSTDDPTQDSLGVDALIYDEYILRRTWNILGQRAQISLPRDYRPLIEFVYDDKRLLKTDPLFGAWDKLDKKQAKATGEARLRILPEPSPWRSFVAGVTRQQFVEDENSAAWMVAQTRLGEETVNVIPLWLDGEYATLWANNTRVHLNEPVSRAIQLQMLGQSIRVGQRDAVPALRQQELPALFTKSALLKDVFPLWLVDGKSELGAGRNKITLILDPILGLIFKKGG